MVLLLLSVAAVAILMAMVTLVSLTLHYSIDKLLDFLRQSGGPSNRTHY